MQWRKRRGAVEETACYGRGNNTFCKATSFTHEQLNFGDVRQGGECVGDDPFWTPRRGSYSHPCIAMAWDTNSCDEIIE